MTPDRQNRLDRQLKLGKDNGMRLRLRWESGFTVTVQSWEAAAAIVGRTSASTLRQYWYKPLMFKENLDDGFLCQNPDTYQNEKCFFVMEQNARRGAPRDPAITARKKAEAQLRITKLRLKLALAEQELEAMQSPP